MHSAIRPRSPVRGWGRICPNYSTVAAYWPPPPPAGLTLGLFGLGGGGPVALVSGASTASSFFAHPEQVNNPAQSRRLSDAQTPAASFRFTILNILSDLN